MNLLAPKLLYIVINIGIAGIALYKCNSLGLLPSIGDWVSFMAVRKVKNEKASFSQFQESGVFLWSYGLNVKINEMLSTKLYLIL
jgi:hypothetical protein